MPAVGEGGSAMAGSRRARGGRDPRQRRVVFSYTLAWFIILGWLGWMVATDQPIFGYKVPPELKVIPTAVPWYGALGGVLISLVGVHEHRYDWDPRYWTWYVARPAVGAFVAIIAVLIFQSGVLAIGVNPDSASSSTVPKDLFYYVIAFATGYREDAFRTLLRKVVDMLFTSKDAGTLPTITGVDPELGPPGTTVKIKGSAFKGVQVVRIGSIDLDFQFASDAEVTATIPDDLEPGKVDVSVSTSDTTVTRAELFEVTAAAPPQDPANPDPTDSNT
jgi:hypothetical protein